MGELGGSRVKLPPTYGEIGDGLLLFYQRYPIYFVGIHYGKLCLTNQDRIQWNDIFDFEDCSFVDLG